MITTSDFSKGKRFLHNNEPYQIVDVSLQSPTARGGNTLCKVKARNLLSGKLISESFKGGTKFDEPDIRFNNVQYLYDEGNDVVFMDQTSYEQFNVAKETIGGGVVYLTEELKVKAMYFNDSPINIELPQYVEVVVSSVEPGTRGNTASGSVTTKATLENGQEVQVPLNIKDGDRILVEPGTNTFYQRA